jgi:hypothetical protein
MLHTTYSRHLLDAPRRETSFARLFRMDRRFFDKTFDLVSLGRRGIGRFVEFVRFHE